MNRLLALCAALLVPALAWADAVTVAWNQRAQLGRGLPYLQIQIHEPIAGFEVKLTRSDGKQIRERGGGPPGVTRKLELQQPEGKFHYAGELVVNFKNGESASMPIEFDAELWGPLKISVDKKDVDLGSRTLSFKSNRPVEKVEVEVVRDDGEVVFKGEVEPKQAKPEGPVVIAWPQAEGNVLKIGVRAHDANGYYDGFDLFPYEVYVPHEEIVFESGKAEVLGAEEEKLEAVYPELSKQIQRASRWAPVKLYLVGHTDTVGSKETNRALSFQRARAIGQWFKKRGVRIPIYYEGFGEEAPAVPTADETDEKRNRRADYILSVEEPSFTNAPFAAKWKKL